MAETAAKSYPVEALANTILDLGEKCGKAIGPMKLQKLMYLAHGYYLALSGQPLVDEFFEAWQYGPVLPTIYQAFKHFGGADIKKGARASCLGFGGDNEMILEEPVIPPGNPIFQKVLRFVFDRYADKSAIYLSDLTHKIGSPWYRVKSAEPNMRNADIPNPYIEEYFKSFV